MLDFSDYQESGKYYAGSERKVGITTSDGTCYMLKFPKKTAFGKSVSHVSEHVGSSIFRLVGMSAQETCLGMYCGEEVVACKDFNVKGAQFVPFNEVGESTLEEDKESYQYDYEDIMRMLRENTKLTDVEETIAVFWRMYVLDALIGNFDRHGSNWGFVKKGGKYFIAPMFDNGSCLFPRLMEGGSLEDVLNSAEEMKKRVYEFPTSQVKMGGKKSSYYQVISSCEYEECNAAVVWVIGRLDMGKVHDLLDSLPFVSDLRRRFYREMLDLRYELILMDAYRKIGGSL